MSTESNFTRVLLGAMLVLGAALATSAAAEELQFTYSESGAGAIDFSFLQSSNPTPLSYRAGDETITPVTDWSGNIGPSSSIEWFSTLFSGMFDTLTSPFYVVVGPQVYTGPESNPVFAPGTFMGLDEENGLTGTLTISVASTVPEPSPLALFGAVLLVMGVTRRFATLRSSG